jgi:hypothetical protein
MRRKRTNLTGLRRRRIQFNLALTLQRATPRGQTKWRRAFPPGPLLSNLDTHNMMCLVVEMGICVAQRICGDPEQAFEWRIHF